MNGIPLPEPLDLSDKSNVTEKWSLFKIQWNNYITIAEACSNKLNARKVRLALFQSVLGSKALQLAHKLCEDDAGVEQIISRLDEYFLDAKNVTYERFLFNSAIQAPDESCKDYINRLHEMVRKCDFENLANLSKLEIEENLLCDRLVAGLSDSVLRKQLLTKTKLTLAKATQFCRCEEKAKAQAKGMQARPNPIENELAQDNEVESSFKVSGKANAIISCKFCGNRHEKGAKNCPAFGKSCVLCKKKNHFAKVCLQSKENIRELKTSYNNQKDDDSNSCDGGEVYVVKGSNLKKRLFVDLKVPTKKGMQVLKCQLDSGATCNVVGYETLQMLLQVEQLRLEPSSTTLTFYGGSSKPSLGKINLHILWKNIRHKMMFEVISTQQNPLIGAQDCLRLGLIAVDSGVFHIKSEVPQNSHNILSSFPNVFKGLGCFRGHYDFKLDNSVAPVAVPPRRYPLALRDEIKNEIIRLEKMQVIEKVTESSEWISPMVIVKKPNKLRICIDPHHLNKALKRPHYQIPTVEEIFPQLTKAKLFSTLDLKDGFWHVKLSEDSSKATTFWTPFGRYRWLRLPFGVKTAPEEFQRRAHEELENLNGVIVIADDVLVFGSGDTDEEALIDHNKNLKALLQQAQQRNLKFNLQKCNIGMKEVKYMGHIISKDGLKPDPSKIIAVKSLKKPQSRDELQRFLGFITYLGKFIPRLSEESAPLRALIKNEIDWIWNDVHDLSFNRLISIVTSDSTLQYFDQNKPVTLQCDASQFGLGATLLQDGKPVIYISRTLNATESAYAQIEKECLAVLFAFERLEQYLFGKCDITVETDHKPLESIFKKPLGKAPKRLQRMLLRLQKFHFNVVYRPGKTIVVADFLSRAPISKDRHCDDKNVLVFNTSELEVIHELECCKSLQYVNVSEERLSQIKTHTANDRVLNNLIRTIQNGWPGRKSQVPDELRLFWPYRDELGTDDGILLKGEQIVVPDSMRADIFKKIHSTHQASDSCIRRAKDVFFWPKMADYIRQEISKCKICKKYSPAQQKEPLILQETPNRPWQKVAVDFCEDGSSQFIIVSDYYSSFFEFKKTTTCTAQSLITFCKELFARYGIPDTVVTDSGTPFTGREFNAFSLEWNFKIITSSPYHHQANGKVESAVKSFKSLLRKVKEDKTDIHQALLELRNTPLQGIGYSPAQLLMTRRTQTTLPTNSDLLNPTLPRKVVELWDKKKNVYKKAYDVGAKELSPLSVGQTVWVKRKPQEKNEPWVEGKVLRTEGNRKYLVEVNGQLFVRNRKFLRV